MYISTPSNPLSVKIQKKKNNGKVGQTADTTKEMRVDEKKCSIIWKVKTNFTRSLETRSLFHSFYCLLK